MGSLWVNVDRICRSQVQRLVGLQLVIGLALQQLERLDSLLLLDHPEQEGLSGHVVDLPLLVDQNEQEREQAARKDPEGYSEGVVADFDECHREDIEADPVEVGADGENVEDVVAGADGLAALPLEPPVDQVPHQLGDVVELHDVGDGEGAEADPAHQEELVEDGDAVGIVLADLLANLEEGLVVAPWQLPVEQVRPA